MKYAVIRTLSATHSVTRLCAALEVSHSGYYEWRDRKPSARAVENERNIRDDQAKACARTGGGGPINGVGIFLGDNESSAEAMFRHLDHWVSLIGPDHVGIDCVSDSAVLMNLVRAKAGKYPSGQSYDRDVAFGSPEQVPRLTEMMLARGYGEAQVRGILGGNWLRVARQIWK